MTRQKVLLGAGAVVLAWLYYRRSYRYRDPVRLPSESTGILAPADGTVEFVRRTDGGWLIGLRLSPLSVRYVYAPQDGQLQALERQQVVLVPGQPAQDGLSFTFDDGLGVQLASRDRLSARSYFEAGQAVRRGNKLAYLERGDLVTVTLSEEHRPAVRVGEKVTGAQTVINR